VETCTVGTEEGCSVGRGQLTHNHPFFFFYFSFAIVATGAMVSSVMNGSEEGRHARGRDVRSRRSEAVAFYHLRKQGKAFHRTNRTRSSSSSRKPQRRRYRKKSAVDLRFCRQARRTTGRKPGRPSRAAALEQIRKILSASSAIPNGDRSVRDAPSWSHSAYGGATPVRVSSAEGSRKKVRFADVGRVSSSVMVSSSGAVEGCASVASWAPLDRLSAQQIGFGPKQSIPRSSAHALSAGAHMGCDDAGAAGADSIAHTGDAQAGFAGADGDVDAALVAWDTSWTVVAVMMYIVVVIVCAALAAFCTICVTRSSGFVFGLYYYLCLWLPLSFVFDHFWLVRVRVMACTDDGDPLILVPSYVGLCCLCFCANGVGLIV